LSNCRTTQRVSTYLECFERPNSRISQFHLLFSDAHSYLQPVQFRAFGSLIGAGKRTPPSSCVACSLPLWARRVSHYRVGIDQICRRARGKRLLNGLWARIADIECLRIGKIKWKANSVTFIYSRKIDISTHHINSYSRIARTRLF
jgi:hypothetical protein